MNLSKAIYTLLIIITVVIAFPGFVTVTGFAYALISHWCGVDNSEMVIDVISSVWRLYGIIQ